MTFVPWFPEESRLKLGGKELSGRGRGYAGVDLAVVVGTRPEIVKMAPLLLALREAGLSPFLIHSGQHYDREMSEVFVEELGLDPPDAFLDIRSGTHAEQTAEALVELENAFLTLEPPLVLAQGDTNTVLAAALAAVKLGVDVGHVEAGLRSHDLRMPEEHNRRMADHLASYLFAPTEVAADNLQAEGVWGRVFLTGNTVIDACLRYLPLAERRSPVLGTVAFEDYCLVTAHRAENVDDAATLASFVEIFTSLPHPVVYPIHPRTRGRLKDFGLYDRLARAENVQLLPPQGYLDFLVLMKHARFLLTDSGGIQEEATAPNIRRKVFVLRETTERPEAVSSGHAEVVGTRAEEVLSRVQAYVEGGARPPAVSPYGDGTSARRIAAIVLEVLEEPGVLGRRRRHPLRVPAVLEAAPGP